MMLQKPEANKNCEIPRSSNNLIPREQTEYVLSILRDKRQPSEADVQRICQFIRNCISSDDASVDFDSALCVIDYVFTFYLYFSENQSLEDIGRFIFKVPTSRHIEVLKRSFSLVSKKDFLSTRPLAFLIFALRERHNNDTKSLKRIISECIDCVFPQLYSPDDYILICCWIICWFSLNYEFSGTYWFSCVLQRYQKDVSNLEQIFDSVVHLLNTTRRFVEWSNNFPIGLCKILLILMIVYHLFAVLGPHFLKDISPIFARVFDRVKSKPFNYTKLQCIFSSCLAGIERFSNSQKINGLNEILHLIQDLKRIFSIEPCKYLADRFQALMFTLYRTSNLGEVFHLCDEIDLIFETEYISTADVDEKVESLKYSGLANEPKTCCYGNSVLQMLYHNRKFRESFDSNCKMPIHQGLTEVFSDLDAAEPGQIVNALKFITNSCPTHFSPNSHEDAVEYLTHLLSSLKSESEAVSSSTSSYISELFDLRLVQKYVCSTCESISGPNEEIHSCLNTSIDKVLNPQNGVASVQEMIETFYKDSIPCNEEHSKDQLTSIRKSPRCLLVCVQLSCCNDKRLYKDCRKFKVNDRITLQLENGSQRNYELSGVLVHCGMLVHFGHYVCVNKIDGQWILFNDEIVSACSLESILKEQSNVPYLMLYIAED